MQEKELSFSREFEVRFSEVDIMGVVWHGAYPLYLEDAREAWGHHYGLCYDDYLKNNVFAPIVDMDIRYQHPIFYATRPRIDITYKFSPAAKIVFDYEIHDTKDNAFSPAHAPFRPSPTSSTSSSSRTRSSSSAGKKGRD